MRKLMNKKGFSLVELMIVVVIMGILIAVAIPLYGAITDNANNKTCANNIKTIKSNAANYKATWNANVDATELAKMFDDGKIPTCPLSESTGTAYTITYNADGNGNVRVVCPNVNDGTTGDNTFHTSAKTGSYKAQS